VLALGKLDFGIEGRFDHQSNEKAMNYDSLVVLAHVQVFKSTVPLYKRVIYQELVFREFYTFI